MKQRRKKEKWRRVEGEEVMQEDERKWKLEGWRWKVGVLLNLLFMEVMAIFTPGPDEYKKKPAQKKCEGEESEEKTKVKGDMIEGQLKENFLFRQFTSWSPRAHFPVAAKSAPTRKRGKGPVNNTLLHPSIPTFCFTTPSPLTLHRPLPQWTG